MVIFTHVHTYGNNAKQGADKMLQALLEYLARRGCDVTVGIDDCPEHYELNGVKVISSKHLLGEHYEQSDAIIVNIEMNHPALTLAKRFNKPIFQIAHNAENPTYQPYIIYNSQSLKDQLRLPYESIIVNPPTYLKDWDNDIDHFEQPYITLVNCCPNKGAETLFSLATWMNSYKFLGIYGGYGNQMSKGAQNLTYRPFQSPISYADTRVLIVPSKKESWSLAAAEAMASGIPVVCADLPGLRENCGGAAIYCSTIREYMDAILLLDTEQAYRYYADLGRKRIEERNTNEQLDNLYNFIAVKVNKDTVQIEKELLHKEILDLGKTIPSDGYFEKEKQEMQPVKEKREIKKPAKKKIKR